MVESTSELLLVDEFKLDKLLVAENSQLEVVLLEATELDDTGVLVVVSVD